MSTLEDLGKIPLDEIINSAQTIGKDWKINPYYLGSEKDIFLFWSENSRFRKLFSLLRMGHVVEIACGYGKQSQFIVSNCERLYLTDINEENINACKTRYSSQSNVDYLVNNGVNLPQILPSSIDSVFCYDAMVHFPPEVVFSYIKEIKRILKVGGKALLHHSNLKNPPFENYSQNPHARNKMSKEMISEFARDVGLTVLVQEVFAWGNEADLDCLTLFEKKE